MKTKMKAKYTKDGNPLEEDVLELYLTHEKQAEQGIQGSVGVTYLQCKNWLRASYYVERIRLSRTFREALYWRGRAVIRNMINMPSLDNGNTPGHVYDGQEIRFNNGLWLSTNNLTIVHDGAAKGDGNLLAADLEDAGYIWDDGSEIPSGMTNWLVYHNNVPVVDGWLVQEVADYLKRWPL